MHPNRSKKITRALGVNPQEERKTNGQSTWTSQNKWKKDRNSNVNHIKKQGKERIGDSNEADQLLFKNKKKETRPY